MCGIIGCCGKGNAIKFLHEGLKALEYRGYDSAGISFFEGGKICTIKRAGTVEHLFEDIDPLTDSCIGIGHTRWATHGKASDANSHPHLSADKKVAVVHNGIVENYLEIKQKYFCDTQFLSETDTEVVANLIAKKYAECKDKIEAILSATKEIVGSFALAILFADDDKKLFFAKRISPLLIGIGKEQNFLSSDILGFGAFAKQYVDILDGEVGYIEKSNFHIFDKNGKEVKAIKKDVPSDRAGASMGGYPHYMIKEIHEIPKILQDTCSLYEGENSPLFAISSSWLKNINRIKLVACGTSYHACMIGEKLLQELGFDATSEIASEFIYAPQILNKNTLCVFISQSGETADTLTAIKIAKAHHAKTVGITNVQTSSITKLCDVILPIKCGAEIAVASTKAYNGQLCALLIFANYIKFLQKQQKMAGKPNSKANLKGKAKKLGALKAIEATTSKIKQVASAIDIANFDEQTKPLVVKVLSAKNLLMVGKNYDYVLAMESALKLKEISYLNTVAYASGELKHGTISLVESGSLIFAFVTERALASKTMNVIRQTQSRNGTIVLITQFDDLLADDSIDLKIALPNIDQNLLPFVAVIPMQLLAYRVSTALGYNPDKPRNLAKSVTVE